MKYLIFGMAALLAGECALAQTTAPATAPSEPAKKEAVTQPAPAAAPSEPAKKDAVTQPAPVKGAAAAKNVGTKDKTGNGRGLPEGAGKEDRPRWPGKTEAKGGDPKNKTKTPAEDRVRPGSMMTDDERAAHRKKLQSFKTLTNARPTKSSIRPRWKRAPRRSTRRCASPAVRRAIATRSLPAPQRRPRARPRRSKVRRAGGAAAPRVFVEARTAASRSACCVSYQARQTRTAAATATRSAISASQRLRTRCAAANSRIAVSDAAGGLLRRW